MRTEGNQPAVARAMPLKHLQPMSLDPDTFKPEAGNLRWRFYSTAHHAQFDIAVPSDDNFKPDPAALSHLEAALSSIDALYATALAAAEKGWTARYSASPRPREDWGLVRLFADATGRLVLSLNESEIDTYSLWDVTLIDGQATGINHRPWGGSAAT